MSENVLQVAFTCHNTLITTEFIPDTTFISETTFETTSVNIAQETITAVAPTSVE